MEADQPSETYQNSSNNKQQAKGQFMYLDELVCYNEQLFRVEGEQLQETLHRSMVAITFLNPLKRINAGSGALISRDVVLTAAHNIFNKELNAENSDFKIYIGANGVAEKYYQVEAWRYPEQFKSCKPSAKLPYDYAILKLKTLVSIEYFLTLSLACEECLKRENKDIVLNLYGFPCSYPADSLGNVRPFEDNFRSLDKYGRKIKLYQYGLSRENRIANIDTVQFRISYGISTLPGQSGCPVVDGNGIIAIHVGGDKTQFNVGRIVDVSLMNSLWNWVVDLNADPFWLLHRDQSVCLHVKDTLEELRCRLTLSQPLENIDLQEYGNLIELYLYNNKLRQIELKHCPRLMILSISYNLLDIVDLKSNKLLTSLDLSRNFLQEIDVTANKYLIHLNIQLNKLQFIDLRANKDLTELNLDYNQLENIDLQANILLKNLDMKCNKLQKIDLKSNIQLNTLNLFGNQLQKIDLETNVKLTFLSLFKNQLSQINLQKNSNLERLFLWQNRLSLIRLQVSENVDQKVYTRKDQDNGFWQFDLFTQQSVVCRVQLLYNETTKQKAIKIADKWREIYRFYEHKYHFQVV